jgi:hypothetical protein
MTAEDLAQQLQARRVGSGWRARCPAHEDKTPSLSIGVGTDGRVLIYCFAGCTFSAIVAACGLEPGDLSPEPVTARHRRPRSAAEMPTVLEWLCETRRIPQEEAAHILAAATRSGPAVIFRYADRTGQHFYDKYWTINEKKLALLTSSWKERRGLEDGAQDQA